MPSPMFDMQRLRASLQKYGRTGVLVYLGISGCVTGGGFPSTARRASPQCPLVETAREF